MKAAATFCVLMVVCFFSTGDAANNAGTNAISTLKSTTKTTTSQLDRYGRTMIYDLNSKLGNQKINALTTINSITNPTMDSIRAAIDKAKANGKDAEHCYEPARIEMRQASYIDANVDLDQCKNNALAIINPVKSNIDATVLTGNRILSELDAIALNCISAGALNYQNCIMQQIPAARLTVQNFENTSNELKRTGDSLSSSAVTSAFSCNQSSVDKVRQAATKVRSSSTNCIANS